MRFLGTQHGYYPADPIEGWRVDSTIDALEDFAMALLKAKFEADAEKQKELYVDLKEKTIPHYLGVFEKRINENSTRTHFVGDKYTIADFALAGFFFSTFLNEGNDNYEKVKDILDHYPGLKEYAQNLQKDFSDYLENRPKPRPF